jgi:hypothetical protein
MKKKIEEILSNIKSIGYYLASKKDVGANSGFHKQIEPARYLTSDIIDLKLSDLQFNLQALHKSFSSIKSLPILKIKICIASSNSLKDEREAIESFVFRENDELVEQGIYLYYNVWEKQALRFNHSYKQEDFNKALVHDSEIFICLIGDNVGKFTKEEFDEAKRRFDAKEKPFVFYVYFKKYEGDELAKVCETEGWSKRIELKEHISKELKQCSGKFKNKDDLLLSIKLGLVDDIEIVKQKMNITT